MKKLISLLFFTLIVGMGSLFADGAQLSYSSYSGSGVNRLYILNCLQAIYYTGSAGTYSVSAIVAPDFDIANAASITLSAYTGYTISINLPADRSAALTASGLSFQMTKTSDGSLQNVTLYVHKINKASIPYSLNFSTGFAYNSTTPDFMGWAYKVATANTTPVLSSTSSSHFLAFNPSLGTDSMVCTYCQSNNTVSTTLASIVESSNDGVTWATIKSYNNNVPLNSASAADKRLALQLTAGTQYLRFTLTAKGVSDPYVNINAFYVKHASLINPSTASMSGLNYNVGPGPSAEQSLTIGGSDLTTDISITPPANFEISTISGTGFATTPLTLTQTGGTVANTTLYVRLMAGLGLGTYSGNLNLTSPGAGSKSIALNGSIDVPTVLADLSQKSNLKVRAINGMLQVSGIKAGQNIELYNAIGKKLSSTPSINGQNSIQVDGKGIYLVKVGNLTRKIVL